MTCWRTPVRALLPQIESLGNQTALLEHAGAIAHLPLFKEAPRGVLEPDGLKTINTLAALLAHLRPFARPGLQVLLINAPRPGRFLESTGHASFAEMLKALDTVIDIKKGEKDHLVRLR